ncbi:MULTISPECIES: NF038130 family PEP-CTERM protein [unclassified Nostoc]|uniref:NF038130 family PEP-CTERM protein n=1 Tax=unclassified Nostoc TaxID=2593658 RepID=UPI002AD2B415|nr:MULTISPECIES: NF038130 family PEP-CTERM protein [unclassified Nostoc]MDZ8033451.1 NF038130 family PEP-CTERM protein [Nostoc sp. DedSLP04]MDZ8140491.1 NF038130 family PEP-CTERM protein [Nostoc sp. DedQUE04]
MKTTFQTLIIGASMAIGVSALATAPAHATSFSFDNNGEINTYTGGSNGTFIKGNAQGGTKAAIKALTDNDSSSNVELWYSSETPDSNVGFTATKGNYSATVSSVTANDWNSFGSQWLGDLLSSYTPFQSVWNGFSADSKSLITSYFPSLGMGDPNIGGFQFGQNGGVELKLVGHLDVKTKLATTISTKVDEKWNAIKSQFPQQTTQPTLSQLESSIPQLQTQLSAIPGQITTLQTQLNAIPGQITTLQTQLNAIPGQITTLQTQLNAIPNIPANQTKRQQLTSQISQLNTLKNQTLPGQISQLNTLKNQTLPGQISQLNTLKNQLPGQISQLTSFKDVLTLQAALNAYQGEIAASEIAKVVTGGQTYYAYSFNPTASGITASDDGVSYSAIYTWSTPKYVSPSSVPEPSVVFGILGVAGIFVTQRKLKKVSG